MSHGLLSDEELREIEQQLPGTTQVAPLVHEVDRGESHLGLTGRDRGR